MLQKIKRGVFVLLGAACVGAAVLLFMPSFEERQPPSQKIAPEAPVSESEAVPPAATEAPSGAAQHGALPAGEWPVYHGDSALRGVTGIALPEALMVDWRVPVGAPVRQPPVSSGGRIFVLTARGEILAVNIDGEVLWRCELGPEDARTDSTGRVYVEAPIAVFSNRIFLGTDMGTLLALNGDTGATEWRVETDGMMRGTPNYLPEKGALYVLDQESGSLISFDIATGTERWRSQGVERADGSPAVWEGQAVYGSCASALHVVSLEDGALLRDIKIENGGGQVAGGVALDGGYAYAGTRDGRVLRAVIQSGEIEWLHAVSEDEVFSTPAVQGDWVVVTSFDGVVHALERDTGTVRWTHELGGTPSSPLLAGDKVIVCADGTVYMLSLEDGVVVWEMPLADEITSPAVLPDGLVFGTEDGSLVMLSAVP